MKQETNYQASQINAFIDGELDSEERIELLNKSEENEALRDTLCAYNKQKELLLMAYDHMGTHKRPGDAYRSGRGWWRAAMIAGVFLLLGLVLGYSSQNYLNPNARLIEEAYNEIAAPVPQNYIIHVVSGDPDKMRQALYDARRLVESRPDKEVGRIEVVANEDGLNILRKGISPYEHEIQQLIDEDVLFFACTNAIRRLELMGEDVNLIPRINRGYSAVDRLVMRLREDWNYVKI